MRLKAYSVYDRKAVYYHAPYYAQNDAVAVRTLSDVVVDPNTNFGRHPNDYVLYFVGEFDDSNGQFWPEQPLRHVIDATVLIKALQSEMPFPPSGTTTKPSTLDELAEQDRLAQLAHARERVNGPLPSWHDEKEGK